MSGVGQPLRDSAVLNLSKAIVMVVDDDPFSMEISIQSMLGFGAHVRYACRDAKAAIDVLGDYDVDLIIVDCEMPGMDGYDFVRWLRRANREPNSFVPVIMTASHVKKSKVTKARDCGANFLVTKPFSPAVLLERIVWSAKDGRPFLQVGEYFGPDRRFRKDPPPETGERRKGPGLGVPPRSSAAGGVQGSAA